MQVGDIYKHKYLGEIVVTSIETEYFCAKTEARGIMPFLYNDLNKVIFPIVECARNDSSDNEKKTENIITANFDPSLYGKHRKTAFPFKGTTESERRHSMNSKRKLRNTK